MKQLALVAVLISAVPFGGVTASAQTQKSVAPLTLGLATITKRVMLSDGARLDPGTYEVRLTGEAPTPATGLLPGVERQAEFVRRRGFFRRFFRKRKVLGHQLVNVVPASDLGKIEDQEGGVPRTGTRRVDETPHDFLRIWFNKDATHYLIYLRPPS